MAARWFIAAKLLGFRNLNELAGLSVPIRIALDPEELRAHPLQVGLSMQVDIDISK